MRSQSVKRVPVSALSQRSLQVAFCFGNVLKLLLKLPELSTVVNAPERSAGELELFVEQLMVHEIVEDKGGCSQEYAAHCDGISMVIVACKFSECSLAPRQAWGGECATEVSLVNPLK